MEFPIGQEILNVSQTGKASMESAHQFSSRPDCTSTAEVPSFTPEKIFTSFAKFQGIVRVNAIRLQELLQAPLCFLRSFCFARIRLDPLGGQVLHHDCISMIVSRFTSFTENFVICCNQSNHQHFLHEVRLRQCVCCTGPL